MKRLLLLFITLTCLIISAHPVLACQCDEYGVPICAQYWRADAVFVGQVRDITPPDPKSNESIATLHLIVDQAFRGITTATVDVSTLSGTSCDMKFVKGKRYLFFADQNPESKKLFAGPCSGTTDFEHADDELNYIRKLTQQGVSESFGGRVLIARSEPASGAKILIRKENKSFETTPDKDGYFSVAVAGPGAYTVRVMVPSAFIVRPDNEFVDKVEATDALTTIEYKAEVQKNQCHYRQIDLHPVDLHATAEVSGSVVNRSGRPVGNAYVRLLDALSSDRYDYTKTEADGSFKFEGVAVGEYFLALNPDNDAPGENDPPYGSAFYPNAADKSGATKIVVVEGAKLENLTLRVGRPWKARMVSGKVVWPDGTPAPNVYLSLSNAGRHVRGLKADEKGKFSFEAYNDFAYFIEATAWGARQGKSGRVEVPAKPTNLTLVLRPQ